MQLQELGNATSGEAQFRFSGNIFAGVPVGGVWKLIFEVSPPDATGWRFAGAAVLKPFVEQCV